METRIAYPAPAKAMTGAPAAAEMERTIAHPALAAAKRATENGASLAPAAVISAAAPVRDRARKPALPAEVPAIADAQTAEATERRTVRPAPAVERNRRFVRPAPVPVR